MSMRDQRLKSDYEELMSLNREGSLIEVEPADPDDALPTSYQIVYKCKSYTDSAGTIRERHIAELNLPAEYPMKPPIMYIMTTVFHPNIATILQNANHQRTISDALDRIRSEQERRAQLRKLANSKDAKRGRICLDILLDDWAVSLSLITVCVRVGEMLQYKLYDAEHLFNSDASAWAQNHSNLFPVDDRDLVPGLSLDVGGEDDGFDINDIDDADDSA